MNYANVWIAPQRDFTVLVCINQVDNIAAKASDEAIGALIGLQQSETPRGKPRGVSLMETSFQDAAKELARTILSFTIRFYRIVLWDKLFQRQKHNHLG